MIQIHLVLSRLHVALLQCHVLLTFDGSAVEYGLLHVDAYAILVFLQSLHIDAYLLVQGAHLVGECRHVTLIGGLSRSRHLWQPAFPDIPDGQVCGLLYQIHPPYQRIVTFCRLLTFLQALPHAGRTAENDTC